MIDWSLIEGFEGNKLQGYVPDPEGSHSGVTIGCGVDLGQCDAAELDLWGIPDSLKEKLRPYAGLQGDVAVGVLNAKPLDVTKAEAKALNQHLQNRCVAALRYAYDMGVPSGRPKFNDLSGAAQTILASVSWQYGDLLRRCPKFWRLCLRQDWHGAVEELRDFGDDFGTRRHKEADYLETSLQP